MADGAGSASGLEEKLAGLSTGGDAQNPPPAGEGGEEPQLSKKYGTSEPSSPILVLFGISVF
jgi:hypothetical protein